jgi:hypothetical protein
MMWSDAVRDPRLSGCVLEQAAAARTEPSKTAARALQSFRML